MLPVRCSWAYVVRCCSALAVAAGAAAPCHAQVTRDDWHLPLPPGYVTELTAVDTMTFWAISPDGSTVYGSNGTGAGGGIDLFTQQQTSENFYIRDGSIVPLPRPFGAPIWGWPRNACADGGIIVGGSLVTWDATGAPLMRPTMWFFGGGGGFALALPAGATGVGIASDISWDSATMAGTCWRNLGAGNFLEAVRWRSGIAEPLPHGPRPEDTSAMVVGMSGNGHRILGILGQVDTVGHWIRWHSVMWDDGVPGPVDLAFTTPPAGAPGGCPVGFSAAGTDVRASYDGSVLAFRSQGCTDGGGLNMPLWSVVRWQSGIGTALAGVNELAGMTSDGNVVLGGSGGDACTGSVARIWDPAHGVRDLRDAILADYGQDPIGVGPNAAMNVARGMSFDGRAIIGVSLRTCGADHTAGLAATNTIIHLPFGPCPRPSIMGQPVTTTVCWRGSPTLSVTAVGATSFAWRRNGTPLVDSAGHISGSATPSLTLSGVTNADAGLYDCITSNTCGATYSDAAQLAVRCLADFNCTGSTSVQDLFDFLAAWFAHNARADVNGVGGVSVQDIFDFLVAWFAGC